ncbi:hypothetical protein GH131_10425 [Staphylococcus pseudintermedius]|nr:hypothetical protein [Staphylococcus pseudintermedius]
MLFFSQYYNCYRLVVAAMLNRRDINTLSIWKIIGTHFDRNAKYIIHPRPVSITNELKIYGVTLKNKYFDNFNQMYAYLTDHLLNGTIGIELDAFYLPYCIHYKKSHYSHSLEIIKIDKEKVYICDHFFNYQGSISLKALEESVEYRAENLRRNEYSLFTICIGESIEKKDCLELTYLALKGELNYENKTYNSVSGIKAINAFNQEILAVINSKDDDFIKEYIDNIYEQIKEMSNSRYHFSNYLKECHTNCDWQPVRLASQSWGILGHILLKSAISSNSDIDITRVNSIFKKIYRYESIIINNLNNVINDRSDFNG